MIEIPRELIEKYSQSIPRYTSYPTAVEFTSNVEAEAWGGCLERLTDSPGNLSLYFHIPFCPKLCYFCACNKTITEDKAVTAPYLSALYRELALYADKLRGVNFPVEQIHWGGGSPNFLKPEEMVSLHKETLRYFSGLTADADVSVELDPRTTTVDQLQALRSVGFNRISFGVQDFDSVVQETVNRVQSFEETAALANNGRALGFSGINLDLIYGLPEQTISGFGETLNRVLEIRPDRVALYGYAHVTWLQKVQNTFRNFRLPTPIERISLFQLAVEKLLQASYIHIGLDHFALPHDQLAISLETGKLNRNFMGYTTHKGVSLLGFGASSISTLSSGFSQNEKNVPDYQKKISEGNFAVVKGYLKKGQDELRGEIIERILCSQDIEMSFLKEHFPMESEKLSGFQSDGLLSCSGNYLTVTELGRFFARNIAATFDEYLNQHQKTDRPIFSQAV